MSILIVLILVVLFLAFVMPFIVLTFGPLYEKYLDWVYDVVENKFNIKR